MSKYFPTTSFFPAYYVRTSHGQVEPKVPKSLILLFLGTQVGFFEKGVWKTGLGKRPVWATLFTLSLSSEHKVEYVQYVPSFEETLTYSNCLKCF